MTRTISLADDAYDALAAAKRPGESFSDVARRLARASRREALFDPDLKLEISEADAERWMKDVRRERDASVRPRVGSR